MAVYNQFCLLRLCYFKHIRLCTCICSTFWSRQIERRVLFQVLMPISLTCSWPYRIGRTSIDISCHGFQSSPPVRKKQRLLLQHWLYQSPNKGNGAQKASGKDGRRYNQLSACVRPKTPKKILEVKTGSLDSEWSRMRASNP